MSGPAKHSTYSAADIQRYWKGEMSAREMHDLEKAALGDPFLADAMEGLEIRGEGQQPLPQQLDDLRTRLAIRVAGQAQPQTPLKIFPLRNPWLRIAAAVILVVGLSATAWFAFLDGRPKLNVDVASVERPIVQHAPPPPANPASIAAADSASLAVNSKPNSAPELKDEEAARADNRKAAAPAATASRRKAAPSAVSNFKISPPETDKQPGLASTYTRPAPAGAITSFGAMPTARDTIVTSEAGSPGIRFDKNAIYKKARKSDFDSSPLVFSGKVLDTKNKPLPGAVLQLAGNKDIGAITDQDGFFSLKVKPNDSALRLTIGMVGYQQTSLSLNSLNTDAATGNVIHLQQQSNALDEVVVVGFGSKRKETRAFAPSLSNEKIDYAWEIAQPVIGKQAYLSYLEINKTNIGADSSIKGTVIISFSVGKNGDKTAFKVEQSLTPAHDAGIIRLISDGPAWKVIKGRSVRTAVRVVF